MAEVRLPENSIMNLAELLEYNGVLFWDSGDYPDLPPHEDDVFITLTNENASRPDLIAYQYYGDSNLIWAILLGNNKELPNQFLPSEQIRIPAKASIDLILAQKT